MLATVSEPRAGQRAVCLLVPSPPFAPAAAVGVAKPGEQRSVANHGENFTFFVSREKSETMKTKAGSAGNRTRGFVHVKYAPYH